MTEKVNIEFDVPTIAEAVKESVKESVPKAVRLKVAKAKDTKCPCCFGAFDGECIKCGTTSQETPTLNGKTFAELFASAEPGEEFIFPAADMRCERSLAQLAGQSVFSNGGIVAALVREGFTVSTHTPDVVFSKPNNNPQE